MSSFAKRFITWLLVLGLLAVPAWAEPGDAPEPPAEPAAAAPAESAAEPAPEPAEAPAAEPAEPAAEPAAPDDTGDAAEGPDPAAPDPAETDDPGEPAPDEGPEDGEAPEEGEDLEGEDLEDEDEPHATPTDPVQPAPVTDDPLYPVIQTYLEEKHLTGATVAVGVCLPETGEEHYYNPDAWIYSASVYKVPLMMIFAEKEAAGEYTQETSFGGLTLKYLEESTLIHSNNETAHYAMHLLGTDAACRKLYKAYAPDLAEDYYNSKFEIASYFSVRYMTKCMTTLCNESERFPNVIDCLLQAQPHSYFNTTMGEFAIAQKYGSWENFQNCAAIVYTPEPVIVTVMTQYIANYPVVIPELGRLALDFAMELRAEQAAAAAEAPATPQPAEMPETVPEAPAADAGPAPTKEMPVSETQSAPAVPVGGSTEAPAAAAPEAAPKKPAALWLGIGGGVIVIAAAARVLAGRKKNHYRGKH